MSRKLLAVVLLCAALGCGKSASLEESHTEQGAKKASPARPVAGVAEGVAVNVRAEGLAGEVRGAGKEGPGPKGKPAPRKIVYTAEIEIVVEDLDKAEAELLYLLREGDGHVTHSNREGTSGAPRSGTWTVRVPAGRFEGFRKALAELGEVRRSKLDSDDVTDRYFDTEADAKNWEAREKALRKLYEQKVAGSKLEDLMAVDREIYAVRGEINKARGQLQRWDKDVAYSKAVITLRDRRDYKPPLLPDFGSRLGRTFAASVEALLDFGKFVVLAVVALAPWLAVLALLGAPALLVYRARRRRRANGRPTEGGA
jgi:hypothetical protein